MKSRVVYLTCGAGALSVVEREPAITGDVGCERAEALEELLELLGLLRERAHLTCDGRLEERDVEQLREALLDVAARDDLRVRRRAAGASSATT